VENVVLGSASRRQPICPTQLVGKSVRALKGEWLAKDLILFVLIEGRGVRRSDSRHAHYGFVVAEASGKLDVASRHPAKVGPEVLRHQQMSIQGHLTGEISMLFSAFAGGQRTAR
jgi:hypothetical protein